MSNLPVIYPMGAKENEKKLEKLWDDPDWVAEFKYDGSRYTMNITPEGSRFLSRKRSKKTGLPVEKTDNLPHLNEISDNRLTILDGEVIDGEDSTSSRVTSIMGSLPKRARELQEERGWLTYVVFDILYYEGESVMDRPWHERRALLEKYYGKKFLAEPYVKLSTVYYEAGKYRKAVYEQIIANGREGIILKNVNALYYPDKKPANVWVKVKRTITVDAVIMGFKPPVKEYAGVKLLNWPLWEVNGQKHCIIPTTERTLERIQKANYIPVSRYFFNDWIGSIIFGQYDTEGNLVEIGATSDMKDEIREVISENPDQYIGRVIEIEAMERIEKTNALRHPRFLQFRDDKNPEECKIED